MMPDVTVAFSGNIYDKVRGHLYPGDGLEAAAILVCTRTPPPRCRLLVRDAILVPYKECGRRARDAITWPGRWIETAIDAGEGDGCVLILIHSHPGGLFAFSDADDFSDRRVLPSIFHAYGDLHGSAIMTPDGAVKARLYMPDMAPRPVDLVAVAGHDISFWWDDARFPGSRVRPLAFTKSMTDELGRLRIAVIGVSGTGSIVAEQLARIGVGQVILIDFDKVEARNLNRILNSRLDDVSAGRFKVDMFANAVSGYREANVGIPIAASITTREAVLAASQADVLFSCVDTLEARQIADLMAAAFLQPLFDVGVVIPVRKAGDGLAIADVCGRVDYVQPGRSSLQDRGVYSPASLRAEYLRHSAPDAYRAEVEAGYIRGLTEEAPAVITLNMRAAAACVNEFVARAYPFRLDPNDRYARTQFSLAACEEEYITEDEFAATSNLPLALGNAEPLLGLPIYKLPKGAKSK